MNFVYMTHFKHFSAIQCALWEVTEVKTDKRTKIKQQNIYKITGKYRLLLNKEILWREIFKKNEN